VTATLADDVVQMTPDTVIRGKTALAASWAPYLANNAVTWTPTVLDVRTRGDMTFLTARFTETAVPKTGGKTRNLAGLALEVYRRDASGAWKLVLESWYNDPLIVPSKVKGHGPADPAEDSVRAVWDAYVAASGPAALESAIAMLHEDVVHMPPGGPVSLGKGTLASAWRDYMSRNPAYRWEPKALDVAVAGDLGFVRYTGSETMNAEGGGTTTRLSSGWDIFRRDGASRWKLIHESWFVPQ
jgi:ketosteroid isomerase-like protein